MPGSVESMVAVNADRLNHLEPEFDKLRERVHSLESSLRGVEMLSRMVTELQENLPNLARQAAREAVKEDRRARHSDFFSNLRTYAAIFSAGAAVCGVIVALVLK